MTDTCTVRFKSGQTTQDEATGAETAVLTPRFTSPCRLAAGKAPSTVTSGGRQVAVTLPELHLPLTTATAAVAEDDQVELVAPSAPEVLGSKFRVVAVPVQSQATARRLPLREA